MRNINHWRPHSLPDSSGQENYLSPTPTPTPTPVYTMEETQLGLRNYWVMLANRRRLVMVIFLAIVGLGAYRTLTKTPLYTTSALLKIEPQNPTVLDHHEVTNLQTDANSQYDYYQTQFALLHSHHLAAKVITELKLESNAAFHSPRPNGVDRARQWFAQRLESVVGRFYSSLFGAAPHPKPEGSAVESTEFEPGVDSGLIGLYLSFLEVKPVRNTRLVEVQFTTPDPRLSKELANAHATNFILTTLETRFELTTEAREFLDQKLAGLKEKLGQAEEALQKFRQQHNVISLEGNENLVEKRLIDLNERLTAARAKRIEAESLDRLTNKKDPQYLSLLIQNQQIDHLKTDIATLEAERARLSTTFTQSHPRIVELDEQINKARQRLDREVLNVVTKIHSDYTAALNTEKALEDEAGRQHQAALNLKDLGAEYTILKEEIDSNRSLYENVMKRLRETTISKDMAVSNMQVAERAEMPGGPSYPKTGRDLSLAVVLGLFLGAGMALFLESIDTTVRTPEDIWRATTYPTLGIVPHLEGLRQLTRAGGSLPMLAAITGIHRAPARNGAALSHGLVIAGPLLAESYRGIRTSLLLADPENRPQVLLLTSAQPGEGKTVTTLNLAISLAQNGRKVVIIDADLRRGRCHALLKRKRDPGLADILIKGTALLTALELADSEKSRHANGMAEPSKRAVNRLETLVEKHLQATEVVGLSFLACGRASFDSTDVLSSDGMKEVIALLRQRFDFVLIDSPPAIGVSDAAVLSQMSDGTVLVARGHKTTADTLRRLMERLEAVHANILGVVLNGIDLQRADYADYRYFYRSYYSTTQSQVEEQD